MYGRLRVSKPLPSAGRNGFEEAGLIERESPVEVSRPAEWNFRAVLVTGMMRSGTTLVANFLNSQPGCVVYADLLRSLFAEAEGLGVLDLSRVLTERERNVLCSSLAAEGWRMGLESLGEIPRGEVESWFDLYRLALKSLDKSGNAQVLGTKITREYRYSSQLLDHGARLIFCVRDPRDVLLSSKNRFSNYDLFAYADSWKKSVRLAEGLTMHKNCELVLFEQLLNDGTRPAVIDRLSRLLGVALDSDSESLMLRSGIAVMSNTSFGDVSKPFDPQAGFRWKRHLDEIEVVFASHFLGSEIEKLGLERHKPDTSGLRGLRRGYFTYRVKRRMKDLLLAAYRRAFGSDK